MIYICIILWFIISAVISGLMIHQDPDEWYDCPGLVMILSLCCWPLLVFIMAMYYFIGFLGRFPMFVVGFLDRLSSNKKERE